MSSLFHPLLTILDKLSKVDDPDVRFMCLRDLESEMEVARQATLPINSSPDATTTTTPPPTHIMPYQSLDSAAQTKLAKALLPQIMCIQGEVHEAAMRCIPGLLSCIGEGALLPLFDSLMLYLFFPSRALPPVHLDSEEVADEREAAARLESVRTNAMDGLTQLWKAIEKEDVRIKVARRIMTPILAAIQKSVDKGLQGISSQPPVTPTATTKSSTSPSGSPSSSSSSFFLPPPPLLTGSLLVDFVSFLHSLLSAHPTSLTTYFEPLLTLVHGLLLLEGVGLLKVTLDCVSSVAAHLSPSMLAHFTQTLLQRWSEYARRKRAVAFCAALSIAVKAQGNTFHPFLRHTLNILLGQILASPTYEDAVEEREAALLCLESLIRSSTAAFLPYLDSSSPNSISSSPSLLSCISRAASYDPNYVGYEDSMTGTGDYAHADGDDGDTEMEDEYDSGGGDDEEEEDDYGVDEDDEDYGVGDNGENEGEGESTEDDEDTSWKVRRAASRCVQALVAVLLTLATQDDIVHPKSNTTAASAQPSSVSLPSLFLSTHVHSHRTLIHTLGRDLCHLLLSRLMERTEYMEIHQQFELVIAAWLTTLSIHSQRSDDKMQLVQSCITSADDMTLQQQLMRLLNSSLIIKGKTAPLAEWRRMGHAASLLATALCSLPPSTWQMKSGGVSNKPSLFDLMTQHAAECIQAPATSTTSGSAVIGHALSILTSLFRAMHATATRLPASVWAAPQQAVTWIDTLDKCMQQLRRSLPSISTAGTLLIHALHISALHLMSALAVVIRYATPSLQRAAQQEPTSRVSLPITQMQQLVSHSSSIQVRTSAHVGVATTLSDATAWSSIQSIHHQCTSMLSGEMVGVDRSVQSAAIQVIVSLYTDIYVHLLQNPSSFDSNIVQAIQQLVFARDTKLLWPTLLRLIDHPSSRVNACESFASILRCSPLVSPQRPAPPTQLASLIEHITRWLRQRELPLLRSGMNALHSFILRLQHFEVERSASVCIDVVSQLGSHIIQAVLAMLNESSELAVETRCCLVLLANQLLLSSILSPSNPSVSLIPLIHNELVPACASWVRAQPRNERVTHAMAIAFSTIGVSTRSNKSQAMEWMQQCIDAAKQSSEDSIRRAFCRVACSILLGFNYVFRREYVDIGSWLEQFDRVSSGDAELTIKNQMNEWMQQFQDQGAPDSTRIAVSYLLGELLGRLASMSSLVMFTDVYRAMLEQLRASSSASAAPSSLSLALAHAIGTAAICTKEDYFKQLCAEYEKQPHHAIATCVHQFVCELSASIHDVGPQPRPLGSSLDSLPLPLQLSLERASALLPRLVEQSWQLIRQHDHGQNQSAAKATQQQSAAEPASSLDPFVNFLYAAVHLQPISTLTAMNNQMQANAVDTTRLTKQTVIVQVLQRVMQREVADAASSPDLRAPLSQTCQAALSMLSIRHLPLLHATVDLMQALAAHHTDMVRGQMSSLLPHLHALAQPQVEFRQEVQYGPSTKIIDAAVPLRQQLWTALISLAPMLSPPTTACSLLLLGLADPAPDVRIQVHTHALPAFVQSHAFDAQQWAQCADKIEATIKAPPPQLAVREELVSHAELVSSGLRAAEYVCNVLTQVEQWPEHQAQIWQTDGGTVSVDPAESSLRHIRLRLQAVVEETKRAQDREATSISA